MQSLLVLLTVVGLFDAIDTIFVSAIGTLMGLAWVVADCGDDLLDETGL